MQYAVALLQKDYAKELQILKVQLPKVDKIPAVRFDKAKELVSEKYNRKIRNPYDLEPEEEALIGQILQRRIRCGLCICNSLSVQETSVLRNG